MSYLYLVVAAAAAFFLWGCVSPSLVPDNTRLIVIRPNPPMYARTGKKGLGDSIGVAPFGRGDTLQAYAKLTGTPYGVHYLAFNGSDSIWMRYGFGDKIGDVVTEYEYAVALQPADFQLPKEEDSLTWNRAIRFLNERWGLNVRSSSDYRLEEVFLGDSDRKIIIWEKRIMESEGSDEFLTPGFRVTKLVLGDSIRYKCESFFDSAFDSAFIGCSMGWMFSYETMAKELAYYMVTGRMEW